MRNSNDSLNAEIESIQGSVSYMVWGKIALLALKIALYGIERFADEFEAFRRNR